MNLAANELLSRAMALHRARKLAEAEALYRQVLLHDPSCGEAYHYLGQIALRLGNFSAAAELLERATIFRPNDPVLEGNLGDACRSLRRFDEAVAHFHASLRLQPDHPVILNSLGSALLSLRQFPAAAEALQRAIALRPDYANAHNNLGIVYRHQRLFEKSIACLATAVTLKPDFGEAYSNLAATQFDVGNIAEAIRCSRRAVEILPHRPDIHSNLVLQLHYQPGSEITAVTAEKQRWNERHARNIPPLPPPDNEPVATRQLRIGYVSSDFRDHVVARNLLPLFRHHAPEAFEVFCYANVAAPDERTAWFRRRVNHWRDIGHLDNQQLAETIRQDRIDVLVDLALHTAGNRLPAFVRRPAPVQVSFAGYPGGTGLEAMDAHLSDPWLEDKSPPTSRLVDRPYCLPKTFWCFDPDGDERPVGPAPMTRNGFVTFGCLNAWPKVNASILPLWAEVLRNVPDSRLRLLSAAGPHRERAAAIIASKGIAVDRLEFVPFQPRSAYLDLYREIDIGLDTSPYNGHSTSLDACWMGVPIVTLVGSTPVGRGGWSLLANLGLPELAGRTGEEFVSIATNLARDPSRLTALRAGLRERMRQSPLMDGVGFARGIEAAYRELWNRWCARQGS